MSNIQKPTGIGRRIKRRMRQLGLTQQAVAERIGWTQGQVSHIVRGRVQMVMADNLFKLADVLQCDPRWLATGEEAEEVEA